MNSTQRDLLILVFVTAGLFAVIYGAIAWENSTSPADAAAEEQEGSMFGDEFKERMAASLEDYLTVIENEQTRAFEETICRRFASEPDRQIHWKGIRIVEGDRVNAFTTIGDRIYLFEGLIRELDDPELLAAVVAHELGHIYHNHAEQRLKMDIGTSLLSSIITGGNQGMITELGRTTMELSYSRSQEQEADDFARDLLERSGIHPQHLSQAFLRMKTLSGRTDPPAFLSSHPTLQARIERLLEHEVGDDFRERPFEFNWQEFVQSFGE